jgi:hypothetical protein
MACLEVLYCHDFYLEGPKKATDGLEYAYFQNVFFVHLNFSVILIFPYY